MAWCKTSIILLGSYDFENSKKICLYLKSLFQHQKQWIRWFNCIFPRNTFWNPNKINKIYCQSTLFSTRPFYLFCIVDKALRLFLPKMHYYRYYITTIINFIFTWQKRSCISSQSAIPQAKYKGQNSKTTINA